MGVTAVVPARNTCQSRRTPHPSLLATHHSPPTTYRPPSPPQHLQRGNLPAGLVPRGVQAPGQDRVPRGRPWPGRRQATNSIRANRLNKLSYLTGGHQFHLFLFN